MIILKPEPPAQFLPLSHLMLSFLLVFLKFPLRPLLSLIHILSIITYFYNLLEIFLIIIRYYSILIKAFNSSYFLSPIPFTFFISSIELNLPFSSLYFTILLAVASPTPGSESNSCTFAVFIFIKLLSFESSTVSFSKCSLSLSKFSPILGII